MESTEVKVKEILGWFLYQNDIKKVESEDGKIKVYAIKNEHLNLVRIDIKRK